MARKRKRPGEFPRIEGLIHPKDQQKLRAVWKAFFRGGTWKRVGKAAPRTVRFRHKRYRGKLRLEWWGKAIWFVIEGWDGSGLIEGAFVGHVLRHGTPLVERIDLQLR